MAYSTPILKKDPDDRLDYTIDWSVWLASTGVVDSIASVVWSVSAGTLTIGTGLYVPTFTGSTATVWLLAGIAGQTYMVTCQITTAAGRIKDFSFSLAVEAA